MLAGCQFLTQFFVCTKKKQQEFIGTQSCDTQDISRIKLSWTTGPTGLMSNNPATSKPQQETSIEGGRLIQSTSNPQQETSIEGGGLIKSAYGASNLPLDFLSGASGKFWRTDDVSAEEVIAAAQALDLDAMRRRRSRPTPPPPAAHGSPPGPTQGKQEAADH